MRSLRKALCTSKPRRWTQPTPEFLRLQLVNAAGMTLAQNRYRYAVYPQPPPVPGVTVTIHDPLNQLQ